jgi:hypothetical protein
LKCPQYIKAAGKCDDETAIGRRFFGWTFHWLLLRTDVVDKGRASK